MFQEEGFVSAKRNLAGEEDMEGGGEEGKGEVS